MKKSKILVGLILGFGLLTSVDIPHFPTYAYSHINTLATEQKEEEEKFEVKNDNLRNRLYTLLGKPKSQVLAREDFLNCSYYIPNKEGKIERKCLDLSYSGITDISELSKFTLPESLVAIDLSGNKIENDKLTGIIDYLDSNKNILKCNLSFNHLDLETLGDKLDDTRIIYSIQNLDFNSSHIYLYDEVKNAKYYIRSSSLGVSDDIYMSFNFKHNLNAYNYTINQVTPLIYELGEYQFNISNPPDSETGYFYGIDIHESIKVITASIRDTFSVERKNIFNLVNEDIEINGFLENYSLVINNASTNIVGKQDVLIKVTSGDTSRAIPLKFNVVDTTIPTITLSPNNTNIIYWRQNREFVDPGYRGDDSGDDLTNMVLVDYSKLDVTKIGSYTITYNLRDLAGLNAVEVIRTVIVQEQVLDEIILRTTTQQLEVGKEIILTVQPHEDISTDKYKDYVYTWYLNGEFFKTTSGDHAGKSTTIITPNNTGIYKIEVKLYAKQKLDNTNVYVDSNVLELNVSEVDSNITIIIAMVVALGIVIGVFASSYIIKHRRSKMLAKKTKSQSTKKDSNVQVIKNYKDKDQK